MFSGRVKTARTVAHVTKEWRLKAWPTATVAQRYSGKSVKAYSNTGVAVGAVGAVAGVGVGVGVE